MLPRQAISACRNDPPLLESREYQLDVGVEILIAGIDVQVECLRRFVVIVDLGEFLVFWLGGL